MYPTPGYDPEYNGSLDLDIRTKNAIAFFSNNKKIRFLVFKITKYFFPKKAGGNSKSATVTSADLKAATEAATAATTAAVTSSPSRAKALKEEESTRAARSSPKPGCSHSTSSEPAHFAVSLFF